MKTMIAGILLATATNTAVWAADPSQTSVKEIGKSETTMSGQPIILPSGKVEVDASLYTIAPGQDLPVHRHQYPRYGYVLSGELSVTNKATNRTLTFKAGQFIIESIGQWHTGRNSGDGPLQLLVIDQLPPGVANTELYATQK